MLPTRRQFLATTAASAAVTSLPLAARASAPLGKAEACLFLWLGGGACQVDTFDPKVLGDPKTKKPGSYYESIPTAVDGVRLCKPMPKTAEVMDRVALIRTLNHDVIDEHAAAVNRVHTGRPPSGTLTYPSIGSVVAHERGAASEKVPGYVLIGYPSPSRGPGFLGSAYAPLYLTETASGPNGLTPPVGVTSARQQRRTALLTRLREQQLRRYGDDEAVADYAKAMEAGFKLAGPDFMSAFALDREPSSLREEYGGEFGQRCLLARRLVERGSRFVEVSFNLNFANGTGWDAHNHGQKNLHLLIEELDRALASLIRDLESKKLLDRTLIVVATEFGRPPQFDGGGGRGHQSKAFSTVLAGGGLKTGRAIGVTDDLGQKVVERPVSLADFFATIYAAMGVDPEGELVAGERPVPLTEHGKAIAELF